MDRHAVGAKCDHLTRPDAPVDAYSPGDYRAKRIMTTHPPDAPLIVFDGDCVLCSSSAQFVLRHDRARRFRLTTSQGETGQALYRRFGQAAGPFDTMLLVEGGRVSTHSEAAIRIAEGLGWPWRLAAIARLLPRRPRDAVYLFVARRRFRWFGRRTACWMPAPGQADRIL